MPKILISGIILVVILLGGFFLIWPEYQKWQDLIVNVADKKAELETVKEYFSSLEATSEELKTHQEALAKIQSALPNDPSVPSLMNLIQKSALENGILLKKVDSFSVSGESIKKITIPVTVVGAYSSLKGFISSLEKSARIIDINVITYSSAKSATKESSSIVEEELPSFNLSITANSY